MSRKKETDRKRSRPNNYRSVSHPFSQVIKINHKILQTFQWQNIQVEDWRGGGARRNTV